jgi:hypothetical protein
MLWNVPLFTAFPTLHPIFIITKPVGRQTPGKKQKSNQYGAPLPLRWNAALLLNLALPK